MSIRYGSFNLFRSRARGRYMGKNRRRRGFRYRRRRTGRALWRGTTRRFMRRVRRSYKDVKREPLALSYYTRGIEEKSHVIRGLIPVQDVLDKSGATGWATILQPWARHWFDPGIDEVIRGNEKTGPIRGVKLHCRRWTISLTMRPQFEQPPDTTNVHIVSSNLAATSISYRVRVILYSYRANLFSNTVPPTSEENKAANIISNSVAPTPGLWPQIFNWNEILGTGGVANTGLNMYSRYNSSHDGSYHVWKDRLYSFSGLRQRTLQFNLGPRILDFDQEYTSPTRVRTPRICILLIFDYNSPWTSEETAIPIRHNLICQSGLNYSLL